MATYKNNHDNTSAGAKYSLSFAQERMLTYQLKHPGSIVHNVCLEISYPVCLNGSILAETFRRVISRHDALSVIFNISDDGSLSQHTANQELLDGAISLSENRNQPDGEGAFTHPSFVKPFNLFKEIPIRVDIVTRTSGTRIFLTVHHVAWDGATFSILSGDIEYIYNSLSSGRGTDLLQPVTNLANIVASERNLDSADADESLEYWNTALQVHRLSDSRIYTSGYGDIFDSEVQEFEFRGNQISSINSLSEDCGITKFGTVLSICMLCMSIADGADFTTVGIPVINRDRPGHDQVVGNMSNTIPVGVFTSHKSSFKQFANMVHEEFLNRFAHKELQIDRISHIWSNLTQHSGVPLFDTSIVFVSRDIEGPSLNGYFL